MEVWQCVPGAAPTTHTRVTLVMAAKPGIAGNDNQIWMSKLIAMSGCNFFIIIYGRNDKKKRVKINSLIR